MKTRVTLLATKRTSFLSIASSTTVAQSGLVGTNDNGFDAPPPESAENTRIILNDGKTDKNEL